MPSSPQSTMTATELPGTILFFTTVAVGAAAIEATLIPGILIGGAAWLAPQTLKALSKLKWKGSASGMPRAAAKVKKTFDPRRGLPSWKSFPITTSVAKTVTFRVISSGLDFGWNYVLLGELATAASLSGLSIIVAPTFYFLHERMWSRVWPQEPKRVGRSVIFHVSQDIGDLKVSKTMAKTATYRLFATISEFSLNYFVVRDLTMATKLSAFSIVAGPFVYIAHEKAWELFDADRSKNQERKNHSVPAIRKRSILYESQTKLIR